MKTLDPKKLSDPALEQEIRSAERWAKEAAEALRSTSNRTTEAGMIYLTEQSHDSRAYLSALLDEREKRRGSGKFQPSKNTPAKEVTLKKNTPKPPEKVKGAEPEEEVEQVPIIVFDKGLPRAWRKGDPIY
jgi:hypothetical protein